MTVLLTPILVSARLGALVGPNPPRVDRPGREPGAPGGAATPNPRSVLWRRAAYLTAT